VLPNDLEEDGNRISFIKQNFMYDTGIKLAASLSSGELDSYFESPLPEFDLQLKSSNALVKYVENVGIKWNNDPFDLFNLEETDRPFAVIGE